METPGQNFLKKLKVLKNPLSSAQFEGGDRERIASVLEGQAACPSSEMMLPRNETFDLKNSHLESFILEFASYSFLATWQRCSLCEVLSGEKIIKSSS